MATIEKYATKAGTRYQVRYRKPDRSQTKKRGFRTKRDAEAFAATVEVSKLDGTFISHRAGATLVATVAEDWEAITKARVSASSWRKYEAAWRLHVKPRWGEVRIGDIDLTDVERWIAGMVRADGVTPAAAPTRERNYTVLLGVLDTAVKSKLLPVNPARGAEIPKRVPKRRVYLTVDQVNRLAAEAEEHEDLILLLGFMGLRWGEAVGLQARAVNLGARRLTIDTAAEQNGSQFEIGLPKGQKVREVPVPAFLAARLRARVDGLLPDELVFPGPDGRYLRQPDSRRGWFQNAVRAAALPRITPHDLRHACASFAVSSGANVKVLQRMLGHRSAAMTLDVYADLFDTDLDQIAVGIDALHRRGSEDRAHFVPTGRAG